MVAKVIIPNKDRTSDMFINSLTMRKSYVVRSIYTSIGKQVVSKPMKNQPNAARLRLEGERRSGYWT